MTSFPLMVRLTNHERRTRPYGQKDNRHPAQPAIPAKAGIHDATPARSTTTLFRSISKRPPYKEQESEQLEGEVVARLNPDTGEVEGLEILFFSTRLLRGESFDLPVDMDLRLAS